MSEIDLIPREYRRQRQRERALRVLGTIAGVVVLSGAAAASGFAYAASRVHAQVDGLQLARRMSEQQQVELGNLQAERARLELQWTRLQTLRGSAAASALFVLIDRTLPDGDLWFDRWELTRGEDEQASAAGGGTQMRITGQARDHAALSTFVRSLYESPEVLDVHLERTGLRRYTTASVVDFELAVLLRSEA